MMSLKDIGAKLPPGFRFHPSDEELVCHYLRNKVRAKFNHHDHLDHHHLDHDHLKGFNTDLVEIDLHTCEPWQLPDVAKLNAKEWYFFSFRDRKYSTGYRTNRATTSGYWKATGKDRTVVDPQSKSTVGMRKTLVFYMNRAPNGMKTSWIMHEFRLECPNTLPQEDWVLCRVFNKCKESSFVSSIPTTHLVTPSSNIMDHDHHDQLPCGWDQTMGSSLSSPPSTIIIDHHAQQHDHHIPCGWEQIMEPHESLLNLVYDNDAMNVASTKGNMFFENTCIGSSDISLTNEIDSTTIVFQ